VSLNRSGILDKPSVLTDLNNEDLIITFDGLLSDTKFLKQMKLILEILSEKLQTPVDVEFASDGELLYILQCRPQYSGKSNSVRLVPTDVPEDKIVFEANKHISAGFKEGITHIVYVDPIEYEKLESRESMLNVGRIVGELNRKLDERKFILMGPGRWGSRGDIKLGVSVTYSDISKTAALLEIAKKKKSYLPEVSFGTHFFLDLVETGILYLPLYPDERGQTLNEDLLNNAPNRLEDYLSNVGEFSNVVRVIDVRDIGCNSLSLVMNADEQRALGYLV